MSWREVYPLEVLRALSDRARAARFCFGEDTAIVAVQHMLRQTVELFRAAADLGIDLKNVFALGKVYSNSLEVMRALREMGVTVIDTTIPEPVEFRFYFQHDIDRLWQVAAETLRKRRIKRVIVLDDAGVCIASVPDDVMRQYDLCGVEQTSSGMFLFEESPPPFAVVAWARAAVKLEIGGPVFSHSFVDKFVRVGSMRDAQVGIIGLGSIGKGIATLAARRGSEVLFYDPNPNLKVPPSLHASITRTGSLQELMLNCDYVFGCSGRKPFAGKWPLKHRPGVKLFSASGGDQEFGPIINDLKNKPDFKVNPHTWDISSEHGPCGPIRVAYLGYPYNFVCRGPEAVPTRIVQLEISGLLASLIQARLHLALCDTGHQTNSGIQRVSPQAQQLVYQTWLRTMREWNVDLIKEYGYEPATLAAAQHDSWFIEKTEPQIRNPVEDVLSGIVRRPTYSGLKGKTQSNLRPLRHL